MKTEQELLDLVEKYNWIHISIYQKLSEPFMEKYWNDLNKTDISVYQKLSESFMEKYWNDLNKIDISQYQKLSESFMEKYWKDFNKGYITIYQKLSEPFMEKHYNDLYKDYISKYQKLSNVFREKYNIKKPKDSWLYETTEEKLKYIKEKTNYEVIDDKYIIAYKSVRDDYYSVFNFQYKYEVGKVYESHCDCNLGNNNSFGLSAWTKEDALDYYNRGKLLKVKIVIEDIGAIVRSNKIRCFKLEVLEEVK